MIRRFNSLAAQLIKKNKLPPRPKFNEKLESECEEKFLHGGRGPGGQKINKCNSKVQLKHIETGVVVTCQETRSRELNRRIAREKMALVLDRLKCEGNFTPREEALNEWVRQGKRAKDKKSKAKHLEHEQKRRLLKAEQEEEDRRILHSLTNK